MNERTTLEKIAPTVEDAVAAGLAELGLTAETVDVEVLDNGSRGLFGVGSRQARIRLTVKTPPSGAENGAGNPEATRGMGLRTMRYRADVIGAQFAVKPAEGGGTVVSCRWAAEKPRARKDT